MAGKLITPVQYEPVLDDLNQIRPLQLQADVQRVISLPVVNTNPANNPNNARGKFLRCDNGAILGVHNSYDLGFEFYAYSIGSFDINNFLLEFNHHIIHIMVRVFNYIPPGHFRWVVPFTVTAIENITANGIYYWPFVGRKIGIQLGTGVGGSYGVNLYAFY